MDSDTSSQKTVLVLKSLFMSNSMRKILRLDRQLNPDLLFVSDIPMTIYIGNLSYQATVDDLKTVFAEYGDVKRVVLPTDRETGRMRGFAFVEMEQDAQEDAAISELDGAEWMGRQLRVNKAKPKGE